MNSTPQRPLSPHLTIWKWGPHMLVSILHRITGARLDRGRACRPRLVAGGARRQATTPTPSSAQVASIRSGMIILAGLTWAFWQHLFSGLRHLVLDTGAGYELKVNRFWAVMTLAGSLFATAPHLVSS